MSHTFFNQFICDANQRYSLIIEDDGNVCYGYLMDGQSISGDIWLYNTKETPSETHWGPKKAMPFLNPAEFVDLDKMPGPVTDPEEITLNWMLDCAQNLAEVNIFIRGTLIVKMAPGSKPGWSAVVLKDGPLAKKL